MLPLLIVLIAAGMPPASSAVTCSSFLSNRMCSTELPNLVAELPDVETSYRCQTECFNSPSCNYFTWVRFLAGIDSPPACFLFRSCDIDPPPCDPDYCDYSVTGPDMPAYPDLCCQEFHSGQACDVSTDNLLDLQLEITEAGTCQSLCQSLNQCAFFRYEASTLRCFLLADCGSRSACNSCWSGPTQPPIASCPSTAALLLGGDAAVAQADSWPCSLHIPDISKWRGGKPGAAVLGSSLYLCGGWQNVTEFSDCSIFEDGAWHNGPSMLNKRRSFTMNTVGHMMVAAGGYNGDKSTTEVEMLAIGGSGWELASWSLTFPRNAHCGVTLNDQELVLAGGVDWGSQTFLTLMEKYNIFTGEVEAWPHLPYATSGLACSLWRGSIYVSGGSSGGQVLDLVAKLDLATLTWTNLPRLSIPRSHHTMAPLRLIQGTSTYDEFLVAFGGYSVNAEEAGLTLEIFNGSSWVAGGVLENARQRHAMVILPCPP